MEQAKLIEQGIEELQTREEAYGRALRAFAEAEHAYRIKRALEYQRAEGTDKNRTHTSEVMSSPEMLAKLTADAEAKFMQAKVDDQRTVISARKLLLETELRLTGQV